MIEYTSLRQTPYYLNFIFNGQMFSFRTAASVAAGATILRQFKTPADKIIHLFQRNIVADGGGPYNVSFIEDPATITDGTPPLGPPAFVNMDRRSTKTAAFEVLSSPTNVGAGTVIDVDFIPTGAGPDNRGSAIYNISDVEKILKPSTNYVLNITNSGEQSGTVIFHLLHYESDN